MLSRVRCRSPSPAVDLAIDARELAIRSRIRSGKRSCQSRRNRASPGQIAIGTVDAADLQCRLHDASNRAYEHRPAGIHHSAQVRRRLQIIISVVSQCSDSDLRRRPWYLHVARSTDCLMFGMTPLDFAKARDTSAALPPNAPAPRPAIRRRCPCTLRIAESSFRQPPDHRHNPVGDLFNSASISASSRGGLKT